MEISFAGHILPLFTSQSKNGSKAYVFNYTPGYTFNLVLLLTKIPVFLKKSVSLMQKLLNKIKNLTWEKYLLNEINE